MSSSDFSRLMNRSISRRAALRGGGFGLASTLGVMGLTPLTAHGGSALANSEADEADEPLKDLVEDEPTTLERIAHTVSQLDAVVTDMQERSGAPGLAVSVVSRDELAYLKGFGVRDAAGQDAVDADTVFYLASLSKPVASTVVAALVGDGTVSWDDHLSDLLPEFQMHDPWVSREVTLRDMFSHRSGLPGHAGDLLEDIGYDRTEVLQRLRHQQPAYSFRAGYDYTNFGLTAAAEAAARAAGSTWEDVSRDRLYARLGMMRTSSQFSDFLEHSNRAAGHVRVGDAWSPEFERDPQAQSPAGGVTSSARDMAQWMRLQLANGQYGDEPVIAPEGLSETHRPHTVSNPAADPQHDRTGFYGLGWNCSYDNAGRVRLSHSGAFELGASTSVYLIPDWDVGICVLTNIAPIGLAEAITASFVDLIDTGEVQLDYLSLFEGLFKEAMAPTYSSDFEQPPASPSPALDASSYAGVFDNPFYGPIEVVADGAKLALLLGPQRMAHDLQHYKRDTFLYQPRGENAYGLSSVVFTIQPDGNAGSVVIDNLNRDGQGTFTRVQQADDPD